jgi:hypothetical protein
MSDEKSTNPLVLLGEPEERPRRSTGRGQKPEFGDPLSDLTPAKMKKATTKGRYRMHGSYAQVMFRLPPEYASAIDRIAEKENMTKADVKRWLAMVGLKAYEAGRRPELTEEIVRRTVDLPDVDIE